MPVPGFISSFTEKAQSAIADHIPGSHGKPNSPDTGLGKNPTFEALSHQFRVLQQSYVSGATPVQKIITMEKSVAIDLDGLSRNQKAQSKELYTWGQTSDEDMKDVADRLAYLNFVGGSLASSLAVKLDSARSPLKLLRDAENAIAPRRTIRAGLHQQLARLEHDNQRGMEKKIAELKEQIRKAEADDMPQEKEIELLKRKGLRESEQLKWDAIREYGEKLVLLSQAAYPVITALPTLPPTPETPYTGQQATGAARASLQRALDNYKTGHINLPPQVAGSDLSRSDTRSFGESHASELSRMSSEATQSNVPVTPPPSGSQTLPPAVSVGKASMMESSSSPSLTKSQSPPINPSALNLSPAPIPAPSISSAVSGTSPISVAIPDPLRPTPVPAITDTPTIAETGVPITGGTGPGPASGSLRDIKAASPTAGPRTGGFAAGSGPPPTSFGAMDSSATGNANKWESAEQEKNRLAAEYSQARAAGQSEAAPKYENEDGDGPSRKDDDDELPPYQDSV